MSALLINLFGGPGTGKSTIAAHVFAELKWRGYNAELVTEFAKDKVWEGSTDVLGNQTYLLGKQYHRLWRLKDKVNVIVTDSPLLLSLYYGNLEDPVFSDYVRNLHDKFDTWNIFLLRQKGYNPAGRVQTEDQARVIDGELGQILAAFPHDVYPGTKYGANCISEEASRRLYEREASN